MEFLESKNLFGKKFVNLSTIMKILILAGGRGTRLWPISRNFKPKQFQKFFDEKTLLQRTLERVLPLTEKENIFISSNEFFFNEIKKQLPDFPIKNIVLEPASRERIAAFLFFFCYLSPKEMEKPLAVFPSDHLIKNQNEFLEAIKAGGDFVEKNPDCILLFGEKPRGPDVGLGYIKKGKLFKKIGRFSFFKVDYFKEKPNLERARKFLKSKNFFWNSGIFIFQPKLIEKLVKKFVPDNWRIYQILRKNFGKKNFKEILKKEYLKMDIVSFDYSILENYSKNVVLPVDFGWSDIGSWSVLKKLLVGEGSNFVKGNFLGIDSKDILVYGVSPQLVATCGVKNLIVVVTDDIVFICPKNKSQDVKKLVEKIEKEGKKEFL